MTTTDTTAITTDTARASTMDLAARLAEIRAAVVAAGDQILSSLEMEVQQIVEELTRRDTIPAREALAAWARRGDTTADTLPTVETRPSQVLPGGFLFLGGELLVASEGGDTILEGSSLRFSSLGTIEGGIEGARAYAAECVRQGLAE
jgi:hypothetical protein